MSPWASGSSGSIAGIIATVTVYPLDMMKTRLTIQKRSGGEKIYNGIWDAGVKIFKNEGVMAFYQGMSCSIAGVIPYAGFTFMSYELLAYMWGKPKNQLNGWQNFINGCLSGAFAQTFSFPFDTVRKKMQAASRKGVTKADVEFDGMIDCFRQTIKKKGILALWAGTLANLAKVAPFAGLIFYIFEWTKRYCLYQNGFTTSPFKEIFAPGIDQGWTPAEVREYVAKQAAAKTTPAPAK